MKLHITALKSKVIVEIVDNKIKIESDKPVTNIVIDPCMMFDLMEQCLSIQTDNICLNRRIHQLKGKSIRKAIELSQ